MNGRHWLVVNLALALVANGCIGVLVDLSPATTPEPTGVAGATTLADPPPSIALVSPTSSATTAAAPSPASSIQDIMGLPSFSPLEPGTYFIDPDHDPSTPLRVVYEIPIEGWSTWAGAVKLGDDHGHVAMSITTVVNLVSDGCRDHSWADPPVGPGVDDLSTALAALAPFQVTSPPKDVTIYGYSGKHLEWTVPGLPVEGTGDRDFTGCVGRQLKSWVAPFDIAEPGDAFYGYTGPGYSEEFWILDVEGTRLMVAAERSPGSPAEDVAELRVILDSIRIGP